MNEFLKKNNYAFLCNQILAIYTQCLAEVSCIILTHHALTKF